MGVHCNHHSSRTLSELLAAVLQWKNLLEEQEDDQDCRPFRRREKEIGVVGQVNLGGVVIVVCVKIIIDVVLIHVS